MIPTGSRKKELIGSGGDNLHTCRCISLIYDFFHEFLSVLKFLNQNVKIILEASKTTCKTKDDFAYPKNIVDHNIYYPIGTMYILMDFFVTYSTGL